MYVSNGCATRQVSEEQWRFGRPRLLSAALSGKETRVLSSARDLVRGARLVYLVSNRGKCSGAKRAVPSRRGRSISESAMRKGRRAMPTTTYQDQDRMTRRGPSRRAGHVVREGIIVGLVGAAVAMVLVLIVYLAAGAPLRTPAMLGAALFHGARSTGEAPITTPLVLGYTLVHLGGFVLFGLARPCLFVP